MNLKDVIGTVTDLIPGGGIVKSLVKGAGSLLLKKAAGKAGVPESTVDAILEESQRIAESDPEMQKILSEENQKQREFELAFYGKMGDLSPKAQLWRAITRPIISFGLVGLFALGVLIIFAQQIFGSTYVIEMPAQLLTLVKWVVAFWFSGRTVEKVVGLFNGGNSK